MSVSEGVSYFSRFFAKFAEVIAVGLATAATGYLIAHLGGLSSSPTPAAIQIAPSASGVSSPPAQPAPPVSAEANEQRLTPTAAQPARRTVNATKAVPPSKHLKTDTSATESQPRDEKSVEARVRDALAKIDANRPATPDVPPHQADVPPGGAAVEAEPRPVVDGPPGAGTVTVVPRAVDQPRPVQQAPIQPAPLIAVERKSRPVAAVEASPAPQPARPSEEDRRFSAPEPIISDLLRPNPPMPTGDVLRPPMPVNQ
jgi:hypothetical protein